MGTDSHAAQHPLPERPNLRHLKDQAKDLVKAGSAKSLTDAQFADHHLSMDFRVGRSSRRT